MNTLVIVESPGKLAKLRGIFGSGYTVMASVGHVRDLPEKDLGVDPADFTPKYEKTERGKDVLKKLKDAVAGADSVLLATDPDREGEAIAWHLADALKLKSYRRITFGEVTEKAVKAALQAPRALNMQLVRAQEARRVLDRLVGWMASPAVSNLSGLKLTAGRVQSPAVRLVVDREREIRAFRSTTHFGATLFFAAETLPWSADWQTSPPQSNNDAPYFMDKAFADAVAQTRAVTVASFKQSEAKRGPPGAFTTSTLQQAASVTLGMNPKTTMDLAQKLNHGGHITYHRTDNPNVSSDALPEIRAVAEAMGLAMANTLRKFKSKDGAQEGHPAIMPAHWEVAEAGDTPDERALYKLIRLRALASQLADARYAVRKVELRGQHVETGKELVFEGRGRTLIFDGWLKLTAGDQAEDSSDDSENEADNPIPILQAGQQLTATNGKLLEKKTKAPKRFTEASLVKELEAQGIGRPSTYAAIMSTITTNRQYVTVEKKFLQPSETGEKLVDALTGSFSFVDLGFTRALEDDLDAIAEGTATYFPVVSKAHGQLTAEIRRLGAVLKPAHPCPVCGKALRQRSGQNGAFWGCSGYPDCKATFPDDNGKPGERKAPSAPAPAPAKGQASDSGAVVYSCHCGQPLRHKTGTGDKGAYDFWGCAGYPSCRKTYKTGADGKPVIPPADTNNKR